MLDHEGHFLLDIWMVKVSDLPKLLNLKWDVGASNSGGAWIGRNPRTAVDLPLTVSGLQAG